MSKEMKKKHPKPAFASEENWDKYLKTIEEFGNMFLNALTDGINKINEETEEE